MKHEPPTRTHSDIDAPPTVIHHYEEDQTLLARWLKRAMSKGPTFWMLAAGSAALIFAVGYLISGLTTGKSANAQAWEQVILASSIEDFQRVSETPGDIPAGRWSALSAASRRYREALTRLPADREGAAPILTLALDNFRAIEDDPKADDTLRRLAMVGVARTLETREELADAIAEYQKVAEKWPNTDEGKHAAKRAERLKTPEAIAFYKKFSTYKPRTASTTIGPRGTNRFDMPPGHPDVNGPLMPAPSLTGRGVPIGSVPSAGDLPRDLFQKSGAERKATAMPDEDYALPDVFPKGDRGGLPILKDLIDEKPKPASPPK